MSLQGGGKGKTNNKKRSQSAKSAKSQRTSARRPRTAVVRSHRTRERNKMSRATSNMSLTELQMMAKSRGVPFGGLSRAKLIQKINNYNM
jgi:hypothetical protein